MVGNKFDVKDFIQFWSKNSFEHIDVLLNAGEPIGANMFFEKQLKELSMEYKNIYDNSMKENFAQNQRIYKEKFLKTNKEFIKVLERLKFEGFNGYSILYEAAYHFLYEQLYVSNMLNKSMFNISNSPQSVVITAKYNKEHMQGIYSLYNQIYFWSLISAEHPSLLMNVTPNEMITLKKEIIEEFQVYINKFNTINYKLSSIYPSLTEVKIKPIKELFLSTNSDFIKLLEKFKANLNDYLPQDVVDQLPDLFYGVWGHILDEQKHADEIISK